MTKALAENNVEVLPRSQSL